MNLKWHYLLLIIPLLLFQFVLNISVFLKEPPVWPDEAVYADVAKNIFLHGNPSTNLWQNLIPGVKNCACWYPGVFFDLLAVWFKTVGISIINMRLFALFAGLIFLVSFYFINRLVSKSSSAWPALLAAGALSFDFTFSKSTRVGRPEIFVLFFGGLSLCLFLKSLSIKKGLGLLIVLSGITASLAFLIHYIGAFFSLAALGFLILNAKQNFKPQRFILLIISFAAPILIWFFLKSENINLMVQQFALASERKNLDQTWIVSVFQTQQPIIVVIYLIYILLTLVSLYYYFKSRKRESIIPNVILILAWIFAVYGKQFWYFSLIVPFIYLSSFVVAKNLYTPKEWKTKPETKIGFISISAVLSILVFLNLWLQVDSINKFGGDNFSYQSYCEQIKKIVPANTTVFLSSIPDPYFCLTDQKFIYEFPVLKTDTKNYQLVLDDSDLVIYNGSYESIVFGDFLARYLEKNKSKITQIGGSNDYQTFIIELKPKGQRDR